MNETTIRKLIAQIRDHRIDPEAAFEQLKDLPFEDLGFAKIDHHRSIRRGYPEAIFCEGKTADQVAGIVERMLEFAEFAHAATGERRPQPALSFEAFSSRMKALSSEVGGGVWLAPAQKLDALRKVAANDGLFYPNQ